MEEFVRKYEIRAHHGMCLAFFEGKGYSDGFVKHMAEIKKELAEDPPVRLLDQTDDICCFCPHNKNGYCESEKKVKRYDRQVLNMCGLKADTEIKWSIFESLVKEKIISAGIREAICGGCQWSFVCKKAFYNL